MEEINFALDTFYAVMAGALVMFMAAGFTMLEAGLVQKKDVSEIVTKNLGLYSIACIMYLVCGFILMYPGGALIEGIIPSIGTSLGLSTSLPMEEIGMVYGTALNDEGVLEDGIAYAHQADFFFQVVFVATAMSIVSGAVAGRMKLLPFFIFAIVLTGFIYPIQGYWNWGGGFLSSMGYSDYAGSGTVHLCGAAAALAVVLVLGPRKGKYSSNGSVNPMPGSNIPMAALGAWILWLGWFGFNGGSELAVASEGSAVNVAQVFLNTNMAAAGGVMACAIVTRLMYGKTDVIQMLNGAIGGLVAITAEPLMPTPIAAILIGAVGGIIVIFGTKLLFHFKVDDVVGAIPAHLFAGIWGTLAVPITNSGANFGTQLLGVISINVFVFVVAFIVWILMKNTMGIRLSKEAELKGTDVSETGVIAYAIRD